jgi:two-component system, NarL family, sensor histidine kinase DevS
MQVIGCIDECSYAVAHHLVVVDEEHPRSLLVRHSPSLAAERTINQGTTSLRTSRRGSPLTRVHAVSGSGDHILLPDGAQWIDELPDGLVVCDSNGTITAVNQKLIEMSGRSRYELLGANVDVLVPDQQRNRHRDVRHDFVVSRATRPMGLGVQLAMRRRDGSELPVEICLATVMHIDIPVVVGVVRDVSERQRVESALRNTSELLTLADERERIARDLHDTVLQRLFGLGMELQATAMRAPKDMSDRVENAVDEIDLIIREIRTAVFTLGSAGRDGSLGQELNMVTTQAKRVLGYAPRLRMDGPVELAMSPEIRIELLASLREALTNVARHAEATEAEIELCAGDELVMRVLDNGRGVSVEMDISAGNGLRNMAERARLLGGGCSLSPRAERGSELRWWVPLSH